MTDFERDARKFGQFYLLVLLGAVLSVALTSPLSAAKSKILKKQRAKAAFETAERLRENLNGIPLVSRRMKDYARITRLYWSVYSNAPFSPYADDALLGIAEVHDQMAGDLDKPEFYRRAISDYQFLIKQYPYSKFDKEALFTIGLIYQNDIGDNEAALKTFEDYLKKYRLGPKIMAARENVRQLRQKIESGEKFSKPLSRVAPAVAAKQSKGEEEQASGKPTEISRLPRVTDIRHYSTPNYTRVVIDVDGEIQYDQSRLSDPDRIFFDLKGTRLSSVLMGKTFPVEDGFLKEIRTAQFQPNVVRVVLDLGKVRDYTVFPLYNPFRLVVDVRGVNLPKERATVTAEKNGPPTRVEEGNASAEKAPAERKTESPGSSTEANKGRREEPSVGNTSSRRAKENEESAGAEPRNTLPPRRPAKNRGANSAVAPHTASPGSDGSLSLTRSLGLKIGRIVIDPGHGGHDYGTIGPGGLAEKDVALDVSLRLGKLLESKLGAQVIYTRDDDTFVPLENRTALANQKQADLFISIHANSSRNRSTDGVETFYLGIASQRDRETLDLVARENAYSERSLHDLQDMIKKITLNEKVEESKEFANDVQKSMVKELPRYDPYTRNRGVKKAHFIVLIGANMPSVLTEISFLSNPRDERLLERPQYRQKIAQALYDGIYNYVKTLSGVKVAKRIQPQN